MAFDRHPLQVAGHLHEQSARAKSSKHSLVKRPHCVVSVEHLLGGPIR